MTTTSETDAVPDAPERPSDDKMFTSLMDFLRQYLACENHEYMVLALWILHTWTYQAAATTPYLNIQGSASRNGKTRCLQLLHLFCPPGAWFAAAPTPAVFKHKMLALKPPKSAEAAPEQDMPSVVLLDDREAVLGTSNSNFVISMLKWGATATGRYTAPLPHGRVHEFLLFCPKALAGTAPLPRAIQERCIPMLLKRIKNDQSLKTFDPRFIRERVQSLRDWLQLWAQENLEFLGLLPFDTPSHLPRGLTKEQIEYTAPLMRICDALGEPWHTDGRIAIGDVYCKNWRGNVACDAGSDPRQLLQDISDAFTAAGKPAHVFSRSLAGHLQKLDDRPWYQWGKSPTYALARMLRPLGVYSRDHRVSPTSVVKVYYYEDFVDLWERY
jgi:hypothetical protein